MDNNPLVSVIIPVYNGEIYLAEALDSVLYQSYSPLEIILIDDGSTDSTSKIAKSYNEVNYYFRENRGVPATLNTGIKKATGDFFAFIDADDIWTEKKLDYQMKAFIQNPNVDMIFGHYLEFNSPEINILERKKVKINSDPIPGYSKVSLLVKKKSFFKVGLFDTQWVVGDFIDWYKRSLEIGLKSLVIPEIVFKRRIHENNMGIREKRSQKDFVHILKKSLDRQRKEGRNLNTNENGLDGKNK